jgi:S-formylglutathione hydrolase
MNPMLTRLLGTILGVFLVLISACESHYDYQKGSVIITSVYSPGLEGNMLGDDPNRQVYIYLPPQYDTDRDKRFPVIYFLHGFIQNPTVWFGGGNTVRVDFEEIMNRKISAGSLQPVILVAPDSQNAYGGSYYTNSVVTGNWEDFIVKDLVAFMDKNYRTLPVRESRGIAGHSMGGYGAMKLAMRNPGVFGSVYSLSPANMVNSLVVLGTMRTYLRQALSARNAANLPWEAMTTIAQAAAFAPDPEAPPFYGQFPLTKEDELIDSVWQKWLQHDPYTMIPAYRDSLLKLDAIQFDCGTLDDLLYSAVVEFSNGLDQQGIDHIFDTYNGDHVIRLPERSEMHMFPFFSENLRFE